MAGLNGRQNRFVAEYIVDFNATRAAVRAGYSAKTAHSCGPRLLENDGVKAAIAEAIDDRNARTRVTADRVVKELARIGFSDMRQFVEWGPHGVTLKDSEELSADDSPVVTEVSETPGEYGSSLKFKLAHKDSALKLLAQHTGVLDADRGTAEAAQLYLDLYRKAQADAQDMSEPAVEHDALT
jgi:phage terminase small subunit